MIVINNSALRMYPQRTSSYVYSIKEEKKFKKTIKIILKKKRLPKSLEISWIEEVLKDLKNMPEHEYNEKYDTGIVEHPTFY